MKELRGEITVYVSLVFILFVTLIGGLMESASIQSAKNYRRADAVRAAECVFAEYQKELFDEYGIFGLEGSYETGEYDEKKIMDRLSYYSSGSIEQEIKRIQFLTDNGCQAFYEQVCAYMENQYGLDRVEGLLGQTDIWRKQEEDAGDCSEEEERKQQELQGILDESEEELPAEDNPIEHVNGLKASPLLTLLAPKDMAISEKSISPGDSVSHRRLNEGYGDFSDEAKDTKVLSMLLYGEYVLDHFSMATDKEKDGALDYEVEYILEGRASDRENLEAVAGKLLLLRFVSNYGYIQTDAAKKSEAEAMALTLCALLAAPAVTEAAAQVILLAWAYGESVVDVRSLLKGNQVPLVKSESSWQLSLSSLMTLGTENDHNDGADSEGGLSYKDYLRMLLFLEKKETAGIRTLDLIEQNMRTKYGQEYFHADQCVSKMEFSSFCTFRRGITYQFSTYYGYN